MPYCILSSEKLEYLKNEVHMETVRMVLAWDCWDCDWLRAQLLCFKIHSCICTKAPLPTGCSKPLIEHKRNTKASPFLGDIGLL